MQRQAQWQGLPACALCDHHARTPGALPASIILLLAFICPAAYAEEDRLLGHFA